jgi:hypothetical protein
MPDPVPVVIIGRLAAAKHREKIGIGSGMLQDAFKRILQISETVGCAAVIVHAIDHAACDFYRKYQFVEFPAGSKTLFLPITTIVRAIL